MLGRRALLSALCIASAIVAVSKAAEEKSEIQDRWVRNLLSQNAAEADQAVLKVFQEGQHVVLDLLKLTRSEKPFQGQFPFNDYESQMRNERPTVGVVSMYLLEATCEKDLFFARPWLVPRDPSIKVHGGVPLSTPGDQEIAARLFDVRFGYAFNHNWVGLDLPKSSSEHCDILEGTKFKWLNQK